MVKFHLQTLNSIRQTFRYIPVVILLNMLLSMMWDTFSPVSLYKLIYDLFYLTVVLVPM
jgi:hypothetical protein